MLIVECVDVTTVHDIVRSAVEISTGRKIARPLLWKRGYLENARGSSNVLCRTTPLSNSEKSVRYVFRTISSNMLRQKQGEETGINFYDAVTEAGEETTLDFEEVADGGEYDER
jgi:hypothetical protein